MTNIYTALAHFQEKVQPMIKDAKGYNYKYVKLDSIIEEIRPLLAEQGLIFYQPLWGKSVLTVLAHVDSGETLESRIDIPQDVELNGMNAYQSLGSALTYLRRYSLVSLLGLATEEDNDAQGQQTIKTQDNERRF